MSEIWRAEARRAVSSGVHSGPFSERQSTTLAPFFRRTGDCTPSSCPETQCTFWEFKRGGLLSVSALSSPAVPALAPPSRTESGFNNIRRRAGEGTSSSCRFFGTRRASRVAVAVTRLPTVSSPWEQVTFRHAFTCRDSEGISRKSSSSILRADEQRARTSATLGQGTAKANTGASEKALLALLQSCSRLVLTAGRKIQFPFDLSPTDNVHTALGAVFQRAL